MINEELLKFVREQVAAKVPKEQIIAILRPGGWTEADVTEALDSLPKPAPAPVVPPPPPPQPPVSAPQPAVRPPVSAPAPSPVIVPPPVVFPATPRVAPSVAPMVTPSAAPSVASSFGVHSAGTTTAFKPVAPAPATTTAFSPMIGGKQTSEFFVPPSTSRGKKLPIIIALIVFLLVLAGAGAWWFFKIRNVPVVLNSEQEQVMQTPAQTETTSPVTTNTAPVTSFDSDMLVTWEKIPDGQNSAAAINAAGAMISKGDSDFLAKYFSKGYDAKNLPPAAEATAVGLRNVKVLQAFAAASTLPQYQCSALMNPTTDSTSGPCSVLPVRDIGRFLLLRTYLLERANKIPEALSIAQAIVDLGRKITAQADLLSVLTGWSLQKDGYQRILDLNSKVSAPFTLSTSDKDSRIGALRAETRLMFKFSYSNQAEVLDYLADKNKLPTFPLGADYAPTIEEYRKSITQGSFNLEETKKYFYDSYKIEIENVDLTCGGIIKAQPYDFSSVIKSADGTTIQSSVENYVGKVFYWSIFPSLNKTYARRCEVEALINKF